MILVDTSAWIEFFRGRDPFAAAVDQLLATNDVALCGPVITELRRGLKPAERRQVLPLLEGCSSLRQPEGLWEEAGELGSALARQGMVVKTIDLLIATYALAHGIAVLSRDADFRAMHRARVGLLVAEP